MRHESVERVQRIFIWLFLLAVLAIGLIATRGAGLVPSEAGADGVTAQPVVVAALEKQIALISGHAGNDSGAVCEDENGKATIQEADINAKVAELAAARLRSAGAKVTILQEYDPKLEKLRVDALLSIHSDSCIDATGFKSTHYDKSAIPYISDRLVRCINLKYAAATGLVENVDTITENMTEYHAFRKIDAQTPAAILELGFLGGDHELLVHQPERAAQGVADGLLCFLEGESQTNQ